MGAFDQSSYFQVNKMLLYNVKKKKILIDVEM